MDRDQEQAEHPVPRFFRALGDQIEAQYRAAGYDEAAFPAIAEAALRASPPAGHLAACDVLTWVLGAGGAHDLPRQVNVDGGFGQPAIQVYVTQRWYIEVLHWLDGTTAIHDHGFNGAFHVLAGASIHARYRFVEEHRRGARLRLGRVERDGVELLQAGDVRAIHEGAALIHSLFHLDRPSVTVVVRTTHVPGAAPQLSYLPPGLAYDESYSTEALARKLQACVALRRLDHPDLEALLCRLYGEADPLSLVRLVLKTAPSFKDEAAIARALAPAQQRDAPLAAALLAVVREERRQSRLVALRARLRAPEPRFLLALLLYFDSGGPILDLVRARWPHLDVEAAVVSWLDAVADLPDPARPGRRLCEVDLRGPGPSSAARAMLGGRPLPEVVAALTREFGAAQVAPQAAALATLQAELQASVFGPLFLRSGGETAAGPGAAPRAT